MVSIVSPGWRGPGFNSCSFLKDPAVLIGLVLAHSEKEWRVIVTLRYFAGLISLVLGQKRLCLQRVRMPTKIHY